MTKNVHLISSSVERIRGKIILTVTTSPVTTLCCDQLADLGDQLILHHHDDFASQCQSLRSPNERLTTILRQMLSIAAVGQLSLLKGYNAAFFTGN